MRTHVHALTCDREISWAVGLSSVILSKAGVNTLIIYGGISDLQTSIEHDWNAKNFHDQLSYIAWHRWVYTRLSRAIVL